MTHLLATLSGEAPGAVLTPSFAMEDFTIPTNLPLVVPSLLVRNRPDIQAAEALMRAANADYGAAIARMYHSLT
jgi:outer membrane protein TolC